MFCTKCGARLNEGAARPASDQNGASASVGGPAAETPAPACEPIAETSPEAPADTAPGPVGPAPSAAPYQPGTAAPAARIAPAPGKPKGRLVARIAAIAAVIAIGGTLLANVLIPMLSPKPWCVGTWYIAGGYTYGIDNLDLNGHKYAENGAALVLDEGGGGELRCDTTVFTVTWKEDEDRGTGPRTATVCAVSGGSFLEYTLICSDPGDERAPATLICNSKWADIGFVLCRDKETAKSAPWSRWDLPTLDNL
uniref:hypothetical protein n=1 Tax=Collinsella bouchesdurhonensis TaxID=1907654 RepID=UPI00359C9FDC